MFLLSALDVEEKVVLGKVSRGKDCELYMYK